MTNRCSGKFSQIEIKFSDSKIYPKIFRFQVQSCYDEDYSARQGGQISEGGNS
jgi:hypothetical protein